MEMEQALQQNPDNLQIVNLLAQHYEDQGKFEAARQLYQGALTRHPSNPVLTNNLCFSYYREGRWQEAETCFRQALASDPQNKAARNNLGLLYCRLGRQDEARRLWQETNDAAAADGLLNQALAALGISGRPLYARRPAAAMASQAPTPEAPISGSHAPILAETRTPAPPVAPPEPARQVATKSPAPTPAPVAAAAPPEARPPAALPRPAPQPARVASAPTPKATVAPVAAPIPAEAKTPAPPVTPPEPAKQVVTKSPAPKPAPVAATPQPEAQPPAAAPKPAQAAATPVPAPQAAPPPRPASLSAAALADPAIEVRNGTRAKHLARQTRSLLRQEGFTVAFIGNHIDFGAATTTIYYRPGAESAAQAMARTVFPGAALEPSLKLKKGMDIKVLLGQDLLENPQFMARLNQGAPAATPVSPAPPAADKLQAAKPVAAPPAATQPEPLGVTPAKAEPQPPSAPPSAKEVAAPAPPPPSPGPNFLTAADLLDTAIEVRNGTWTKNLARQTRSLLREQGFTVAFIGNHIDFGAATTIIYYRPGAEKVAQAVAHTVFPGAELEASLKLKKGMDIKILLGADLLERPQLMARLVAEGK
jgi:thioredoxin-like negative regulator of GroEL